jgi:hypothetical protein
MQARAVKAEGHLTALVGQEGCGDMDHSALSLSPAH